MGRSHRTYIRTFTVIKVSLQEESCCIFVFSVLQFSETCRALEPAGNLLVGGNSSSLATLGEEGATINQTPIKSQIGVTISGVASALL